MSAITLQAPAFRVAAAPIGGAILAKWNSLGGAGGVPGAVQGGDLVCPDRVGHFVHVANGSIYWTPATGAAWVRGPILVKWGLLGWERCALGYPVSDETGCPDGVGRFNHFQSGSIYWTAGTGAFSVHGDIRAKWASLGWERCALGYPVTDETGCPDGVGRFNHFQSGSIYWTAGTGAFSVHGDIRAKWASLGWERCALGYPVTDETGCPDGVGRFNHFQSGSIYWTPATGAFSVHGPIRDRWASLGWERSALGYPVSDEGDLAGGGRVGTFQHGRICWTATTGAWVEMGASVPPQLDFTFSPVVLDAVPVGGFAQLTIRQDGSHVFSGHLHDSGETPYNLSVVCFVKDTLNRAYTFAHSGSMAGTLGSSSRDDDWNVAGVSAAIRANWANLVGGTSAAGAAANLDIASLGAAVLTALGVVVQVTPVAGTAFGGGDSQEARPGLCPGPAKGPRTL